MRAVLRVWWTFFTAVPLQRSFGVGRRHRSSASPLVVGLLLREWFWLPLGYTAFVVFAAFPALFTAPALFRSLSAPRMFQLLPHLRLRMLIAVSLVLCALLVLSAGILVAPTVSAERALLAAASAFLFSRSALRPRSSSPCSWCSSSRSATGVGPSRCRSRSSRSSRCGSGARPSGFLAALPAWVWLGGRAWRVGDLRGVVSARASSAPRDAHATTACSRARRGSTRAACHRHPHAASHRAAPSTASRKK